MEYVRLPMVRTDEKAMVAGYVVYRLPAQVSHVLGLGASTSRWSVHPSQSHLFVTCEKAENGKLYAVSVSEAKPGEVLQLQMVAAPAGRFYAYASGDDGAAFEQRADRMRDIAELQAALPDVVVVDDQGENMVAKLEALFVARGGLILDIPEVKE